MERLDEKIAALERLRRMEQRKNKKEETETEQHLLSMEEMREGIRAGSLFLPQKGNMVFKTVTCFVEEIPLIYLDGFYTDCQETEEGMILVNNRENVGQTLIRLPSAVEWLGMEAWGEQIRQGMKAKGLYADIIKKEPMGTLDYIAYRIPSKEGWVYNIIYRIHKKDQSVIGGSNCMDSDKDTYGRLLEAMIQEMAQRL